jgi:predicted nucleotidyltransferase
MLDKQKSQAEIQQITELIKQAVPVERIYLFGSYAYGEPNEQSDYDFFVVIPDGNMRPLDAMRSIRRASLQMDRIVPMDFLADYKSNFEQRRKLNTLERKIDREGVLLYG